MANKKAGKQKIRRKSKSTWRILVIFLFLAVMAVFGFSHYWPDSENGNSNIELYQVKRGDMTVNVVENGSIKSVKSVTIKTPSFREYFELFIISIVPEGTFISPEDVNNGMVLVELDTSHLVEQLPQREIDVANAESSYAEAKENCEIQIKQNESDIISAEMKVKFARMDIEKYLGDEASEELFETISLESLSDIDIDLLLKKIEDSNSLCEASQKMLDLSNSITMAEENLEKSKYNLAGVQKLYDNKYASETQLRESTLQVKRQEVEIEKVRITRSLFKKFEFPKQVEQLLSNYFEAKLALERTESRARSQLAQVKARLNTAESSLKARQERLDTTKEQIESCTIRAPSPGQVVYYSSFERYTLYQVEQGIEVPRGYPIITIPDTTQMKVEIKVHETWINKIQLGQKARITTTAFPDKVFTGTVLKKAALADSQSSSLLADVKVYTTDVGIDGSHDYLRTGMTAKVEILIEELKDVLFVPIQSVVSEEGGENKICYVMTDNGSERRPVEIGLFNDDFVEIKNGLADGEQVLFNPPRWEATKKSEEQTEAEAKDEQTGISQEAEQVENVDDAEIGEGKFQTEPTIQTPEAECIDDIVQAEIKNQIEETENKEESGEVTKPEVIDELQLD